MQTSSVRHKWAALDLTFLLVSSSSLTPQLVSIFLQLRNNNLHEGPWVLPFASTCVSEPLVSGSMLLTTQLFPIQTLKEKNVISCVKAVY